MMHDRFFAVCCTVVAGLFVAAPGSAPADDDYSRSGPVTYFKDVVPILQESCQVCHRSNGANMGGMIAPMAFTSYEETRPWAKAIAKNVKTGYMPPWHAAPEQHGVFENERTLTEREIATLIQWSQTGAKAGDPADAPEAIEWPTGEGWTIGEPDLIIKMPEPYFVEDDVKDLYVDFVTEITAEMLPEDRWIKAVEFRPGGPVVHHIIALPLGGIAPGNDPTVYRDGLGSLMRAGSRLVWQMHYHKESGPGTGAWDQSSVAIKFYPKGTEIKYPLGGDALGDFSFRIPPGEANYTVKKTFTFPHDAKIVTLMPHMHLRGKAAKYEVVYPDGTEEVLLDVPEYDFNWQTTYRFAEPKFIPKGTEITLTTVFDNSPENASNPDPTDEVRWGRPTTAEMSFGWMSFIHNEEGKVPASMFGRRGERRSRRAARAN